MGAWRQHVMQLPLAHLHAGWLAELCARQSGFYSWADAQVGERGLAPEKVAGAFRGGGGRPQARQVDDPRALGEPPQRNYRDGCCP
jgi:hypothetical protein